MYYYNKCNLDCFHLKQDIKDAEVYKCSLYGITSSPCYSYTKKEHIKLLKKLTIKYKNAYKYTWLPTNPNLALLVCLGAGPWKIQRRTKVQKKAIDWYLSLNVSDLSEVPLNQTKDVFPLQWQNKHLQYLIHYLKTYSKRFWECCLEWQKKENIGEWMDIPKKLFYMCGVQKKGTKTLWMFIRDFLNKPSFPIDRHVSRKLENYGLPNNSWYMTQACVEAGIDGNDLNRAFFPGGNTNFEKIL